jgi:hypothetical protein
MSYGPNHADLHRRAAACVAQSLLLRADEVIQ